MGGTQGREEWKRKRRVCKCWFRINYFKVINSQSAAQGCISKIHAGLMVFYKDFKLKADLKGGREEEREKRH